MKDQPVAAIESCSSPIEASAAIATFTTPIHISSKIKATSRADLRCHDRRAAPQRAGISLEDLSETSDALGHLRILHPSSCENKQNSTRRASLLKHSPLYYFHILSQSPFSNSPDPCKTHSHLIKSLRDHRITSKSARKLTSRIYPQSAVSVLWLHMSPRNRNEPYPGFRVETLYIQLGSSVEYKYLNLRWSKWFGSKTNTNWPQE